MVDKRVTSQAGHAIVLLGYAMVIMSLKLYFGNYNISNKKSTDNILRIN